MLDLVYIYISHIISLCITHTLLIYKSVHLRVRNKIHTHIHTIIVYKLTINVSVTFQRIHTRIHTVDYTYNMILYNMVRTLSEYSFAVKYKCRNTCGIFLQELFCQTCHFLTMFRAQASESSYDDTTLDAIYS